MAATIFNSTYQLTGHMEIKCTNLVAIAIAMIALEAVRNDRLIAFTACVCTLIAVRFDMYRILCSSLHRIQHLIVQFEMCSESSLNK